MIFNFFLFHFSLLIFYLNIMRKILIAFLIASNFLILGCVNDNNKDASVDPDQNNPGVEFPFSEVGSMSAFAPESSGLVFMDGFIYTFNDSGNQNEFYKVNAEDATLVQTITITNHENIDWEDITVDENYIYIGDFGNNNGIRRDLKVLKIAKSQFVNEISNAVNVTAEVIEFSYSEQTSFESSNSHNFDCETLISKGDSLYLFTKNRGDNATNVYKLSKNPGQYTLISLTSFNVNGRLTGGDYNSQINEVVLIGYSSGHKNSFIYCLSNFNEDLFFSGNITKKIIGNASNDWQTEGIAYNTNDSNTIFFSCETTDFSQAKLYTTTKTRLGL